MKAVRVLFLAALVMVSGLAFAADKNAGKQQTWTGEVSDTMCGAKHMMDGGAAACTKSCVDGGSKYALVVGDKVYTLEGDKTQLEKYAGEKVKVTGTAKGDTIQAASVEAAGK